MNIQKCGVIGCGGVGATSAYTLIESGIFNEVVLIDVNAKKAEGEALDIGDGIPFTVPSRIYAGTYEDLKDAYLVIITAGVNQKPGETRLDISAKNGAIFRQIIPEIVKHNSECILLVVTNPVDVLTTLTLKLSGFPKERVLGSGTVLDTARLKYKLGEAFNLDSRDIHTWIIGEHGDTELATWRSTAVAGIPLDDYCIQAGFDKNNLNLNEIYEEVRDSAYKIIDLKGSTFYAVSMAVRRIAEALVRDEHSIMTVSSLAEGQYGLSGVCIGLPTIIGRKGVERIVEFPLSKDEREKLHYSAEALQKIYDEIKED